MYGIFEFCFVLILNENCFQPMLFCLGMITGIFLYGMINRIPFIIDPVFYDPGMLADLAEMLSDIGFAENEAHISDLVFVSRFEIFFPVERNIATFDN